MQEECPSKVTSTLRNEDCFGETALTAINCVRWGTTLAVGAFLTIATEASAEGDEDEHQQRIQWDEHNRRVTPSDHLLGGTALLGALTLELFTPQPKLGKWTALNGFDTTFHELMAAPTRKSREGAAIASTVVELFVAAYPIVVDGGIVLLAIDHNPDVFHQTMTMNSSAYSLSYLFTRTSHRLGPRDRPEHGPCEQDPSYSQYCGKGDTASFPSGHVSLAAVAAGVNCAHHAYLPLYGGGAADAFACATGTSLALAVGALRLAADRHWMSDVMAGFALGFGIGVGLPIALHYEADTAGEEEGSTSDPARSLVPRAWPATFNWGMPF